MDEPYGGIARNDRIDVAGGPMCDKAWHLGGRPAPAVVVLRCSDCSKVYARCEQCDNGVSSAACSMRAHVSTAHRVRGGNERWRKLNFP